MDLTMYRQAWNDLPYDDGFFAMMDVWKNIYSGAPPWKIVRRAGLQRGRSRSMSLMNTAKLLCDEFAHKIFAEQVEITTGNDAYDEWLRDFLDREGFWKNIPQFLSRAFAVGGGCVA